MIVPKEYLKIVCGREDITLNELDLTKPPKIGDLILYLDEEFIEDTLATGKTSITIVGKVLNNADYPSYLTIGWYETLHNLKSKTSSPNTLNELIDFQYEKYRLIEERITNWKEYLKK